MNTIDRRMAIMRIMVARRCTTARELAEELGVTTRTIRKDIQALSRGYPIYTQQGGAGGIFMNENYKPYMNTLSPEELTILCDLYGQAEGDCKRILRQIIHKYGPDKLEL